MTTELTENYNQENFADNSSEQENFVDDSSEQENFDDDLSDQENFAGVKAQVEIGSGDNSPDSANSVNNHLDKQDQYDGNDTNNTSKSSWHWFQVTVVCAIKLIISIIAGYLSWKCSAKDNIFIRVLITIFAVLFSEIYILYYSIYRVYMGNKCPI